MLNIQKLRNELMNISDSYGDFVDGVIKTVTSRNDEVLCNKLIEFISSNPQTNTSDVLNKMFDIYKPWEEHSENY